MFAVVADTREQARTPRRHVAADYAPLPAVLDPLEARRQQSWCCRRSSSPAAMPARPSPTPPLQLAGRARVGAQEHFYLEGQIAYAWPTEDGDLHLHSSTQHPTEMQHAVATTPRRDQQHGAGRGMAHGRRQLAARSRSPPCSPASPALACLPAAAPGEAATRPRRRHATVTGKRHAVPLRPRLPASGPTASLLGVRIDMVLDAGWSADLSRPGRNARRLHAADNAYYLPKPLPTSSACCARTQPPVEHRLPRLRRPQGAFTPIEHILDDNVFTAPAWTRWTRAGCNFYAAQAPASAALPTPYGQPIADNVIHALVAHPEEDSDYRACRANIAAFNAGSPVIRKGLALATGEVRHLLQPPATSSRPARWCMSIPTARYW
ncbi:molybdopterin cofactor-binding domain-containing protein [Thauera humireducens]|uniref:molybdopterin cofactor-binding domain-containing protein n=1 Tax=Thauera humireducens TaxID=1134435 RepID=UPI00311FD0C0